MIKISVRNFTHNLSKYMDRVKNGERFVVSKRNQPIADIVPHHVRNLKPGWSMKRPKLRLKGLSLSQALIKYRQEER